MTEEKYDLIALVGKSGSGKDTILKEMQRMTSPHSLHTVISYTTRPPREGEIDGVDYNFVSIEEMTKMILSDEVIEASIFRDWCYGTSLASLDNKKINIGVFNMDGISSLMECKSQINLRVYYIIAKGKTRIIRQLLREEDPDIEEIFRRYITDEDDFEEMSGIEYKKVYNEDIKPAEAAAAILEDIFN